jgi:hypothetical protein
MIDKFIYSVVGLKTLLPALLICLIGAPAQAGSWQHIGFTSLRTTNLINLANTLGSDTAHTIDPDQV